MIEITCMQEGLRRGGVSHPKGVTEYENDAFTAEQLEMMANEKKLIVAVVGDAEGVALAPPANGDRFNVLLEACGKLDEDKSNIDDWTKAGLPQTMALESLSQEKNVSAAERDEVYAAFLESLKS